MRMRVGRFVTFILYFSLISFLFPSFLSSTLFSSLLSTLLFSLLFSSVFSFFFLSFHKWEGTHQLYREAGQAVSLGRHHTAITPGWVWLS